MANEVTNEKLVIVHESPAAWAPKLRKMDKEIEKQVKDRKNIPHEFYKELLLDRDRRFYWTILVLKTGIYNYHVRNDFYTDLYRKLIKSIKDGIKEGWDAYVDEVTKRNVPRETILKALPRYEVLETQVEKTIAFAEFLRSVMVDAGCSPVMFDIEALEMLSAMIDEGCVYADPEKRSMTISKPPSFSGWERYFGPSVTRVNMR